MQGYGTDSDERTYVPIILALVSIAFGWVIGVALRGLGLPLPWWLEVPGPLAIYGVLIVATDVDLWRRGWFRAAMRIRIPDIGGRWEGHVVTSHDGTRHAVSVRIRQSWRRISIELAGGSSRSTSAAASLTVDLAADPLLVYTYTNHPSALADPMLHSHDGTAWLRLQGGRLEGEYYTGRGRGNVGEMSLHRSER